YRRNPDARHVLVAAGGDQAAVRTEHRLLHGVLEAAKLHDLALPGEIPQAHREVFAGADEVLPIRAEGGAGDARAVPVQLGDTAGAGDLPDLYRRIPLRL